MPTSNAILEGLGWVANQFWWVALAWHTILGLLVVRLLRGWIPTPRVAMFLCLPAFSVGALAALAGNPFNSAAFFALGIALGIVGATLRTPNLVAPSRATKALGLAMLTFGWVYPHFLDGKYLLYLVAAPLGTIPCPTLSALCGVTLLADGFSSRSWRFVLGVPALFYGVVGVAKLHVWIDAVLIVGALLVLAPALLRRGGAPAKAGIA